MKVKVSNWGKSEPEYESKYDWDCYCQAGSNGVVFSKNGNYETAFFEAFPKNPKCFIRGEGANIEEAEKSAWDKYQKIILCNHDMERRDRTDGYAYCKYCSYSSTVFEPLTKCCKCSKPTAYSSDAKDNFYCEKHYRFMPNKLLPEWRLMRDRQYLSRKNKKYMKYGASVLIYGHKYGKIKHSNSRGILVKFTGDSKEIAPLFSKQRKKLLQLGKGRKIKDNGK